MYQHRLMDDFRLPEFWRSAPGTVRLWDGTTYSFTSLEALGEEEIVEVSVRPSREARLDPSPWRDGHIPGPYDRPVCLLEPDMNRWSGLARRSVFGTRRIVNATHLSGDYWSTSWGFRGSGNETLFPGYEGSDVIGCPFVGSVLLGFPLHRIGDFHSKAILLNTSHAFTQWLLGFCDFEREREGPSRSMIMLKWLKGIIRYPRPGEELQKLNGYVREIGTTFKELPEEFGDPPSLSEDDIRFSWVEE